MNAGYGQNGKEGEALELFNQMKQSGVKPNCVTYTIILSVCANLADLPLGKEIHSQVDESGIEWTIEMQTSLLNMHSKCGSMDDARSVFDSMKLRNVISWSAMIIGYGQNGKDREALELFNQMQQSRVKPDCVTYTIILSVCSNLADLSLGKEIHSQIDESGIEWTLEMQTSLLNMYAKCVSVDDARSLHDNMKMKNVISWSAMIAGYGQNGKDREALELFNQMQQSGVKPDCVTYTIILSACANLAAVSHGKEIHYGIDESGIEWTLEMQTSLLNMYAKCGSMNDARSVFDNMELKDIISWNAMIAGYGQNGKDREALELFNQMKQSGVKPDCFTYTIILSVCANLA